MTSTTDTTTSQDWALLEQLNDIGQLSDDWDGYGAASIDATAIAHARVVLPSLTTLPDALLPSVAGTVLMEWETAFGADGLVRSRGEALSPDLRKKYDQRLKQLAAEAIYLADLAPHRLRFLPADD